MTVRPAALSRRMTLPAGDGLLASVAGVVLTNPGHGAIVAVFEGVSASGTIYSISTEHVALETATPHRAALGALILAMRRAPLAGNLAIHIDAAWLTDLLEGRQRRRANAELWRDYDRLLAARGEAPTAIVAKRFDPASTVGRARASAYGYASTMFSARPPRFWRASLNAQ